MTLLADLTNREVTTARRAALRRRWIWAPRGTLAVSLATGAALFAAWQLASAYGLASPLFFPSPAEVASTFAMVAREGYADATLAEHVGASLGRMGIALVAAVGLGVPLGVLMGTNRWIKGVFDVPIGLYWPLPPLAYLPLLIIWLGIGEASKIVLLTLAMFAPICLSAQAGVRSVPVERLQAALSLGASRRQVFTAIVLPSAMPEILTGLRIAIGAGWSTLVAAELIAAHSGLGSMIMSASNFLATDVVFVGLIVIAAFAFALSGLMRSIERWLVPWRGQA
jgi:taurine transport system permease protein